MRSAANLHDLLGGVTVLDFSQYLSGPLCTATLGQLGALVIKVEPIGTGDGNRHQPPFVTEHGLRPHPESQSDVGLAFLKRNATKKSLTVDLKQEAGRDLIHRLVKEVDVVIHNFRPGVVRRLGLDSETVRNLNPRVIYCEIDGLSPYGTSDDDRGVVDIVGQALSGIMATTGSSGGPPTRVGVPIADQVAGLYATIGILSALVERGRLRNPAGRHIQISMLAGLTSLVWDEHLDVYAKAGLPPRHGNGTPRIVPFDTYKTLDEEWIVISGVSRKEWERLKSAIPALNDISEWDTLSARVEARHEINSVISTWASERNKAEAMENLLEHGATAAPVQGPRDLMSDERFRSTMLYKVMHTDYGDTGALGAKFPVRVDGHQVDPAGSPAPGLGAHSEEILSTLLGMSTEAIDCLIASHAIGPPAVTQEGPNESEEIVENERE